MGQELVPKLDEGNISVQSLRIPSTSLTQSQEMQSQVERAVCSLPEVELMYSKTGTAEVAFDPMPPNISDAYVILKPQGAVARPDHRQGRSCWRRSGRRWSGFPATSTSSASPSNCGSTN